MQTADRTTCSMCGEGVNGTDLVFHVPMCYRNYCFKLGKTPFCTCDTCCGRKPHGGAATTPQKRGRDEREEGQQRGEASSSASKAQKTTEQQQVKYYEFKLLLKRHNCFRVATVRADMTLDDALEELLEKGFDFDFDHLYRLTLPDGSEIERSFEEPSARLDSLPLEAGVQMPLLYDFGDSWPFVLTFNGSKMGPPSDEKVVITQKRGKPPQQY
ncbi:hypothetical protein QOT17_002450 [Balamuthia mandrillaris]